MFLTCTLDTTSQFLQTRLSQEFLQRTQLRGHRCLLDDNNDIYLRKGLQRVTYNSVTYLSPQTTLPRTCQFRQKILLRCGIKLTEGDSRWCYSDHLHLYAAQRNTLMPRCKKVYSVLKICFLSDFFLMQSAVHQSGSRLLTAISIFCIQHSIWQLFYSLI